jgi:flagellar biosynthesis chaperone FliJ
MSTHVWKDQIIAAGVEGFNLWKSQSIAKQLDKIIKAKLESQHQQNINFENALKQMMKMRQFLSDPKNILGSEQTKHGEIAEHLEVNVRNAWAALKGQGEVATFEGVARTAPEDFILDGIKYQSKFINGTNNTLKHVLDHYEKYHDLSMNYSIPKDQYNLIEAIRSGHAPSDLSDKSIRAILHKVDEIELETGRIFEDIVKPSVSNYKDAQLGYVGETVSNYQDQLVDENQRVQDEIQKEAKEKTKSVEAKQNPSIGEGVKVAATAAAIAASLNTITIIYCKVKKGKKLQDFGIDDWKEVGISSVKAGAKGGVTAGSIYALTNLTSLSAPFAGAVTSAAMGLSSLLTDLKRDQISMDEFVTQGQILCMEAGIAATGGAIGQMLIPIPVLGSVIGTVTANFVWGFAKDKLGEREQELKKILEAYTESILAKVEKTYQDIISKINATYAHYNSLTAAAFDVHANSTVLAAASVDLALELGVDDSKILKNDADLAAFFS